MGPVLDRALKSHLINNRDNEIPLNPHDEAGPDDINDDIENEENPVKDKEIAGINYVYPTPASDLYFSKVDGRQTTTRNPKLYESIRAFNRYLNKKKEDGTLQLIYSDGSPQNDREGFVDQSNRFGAVIDEAKLLLNEDVLRPKV